MSNRRGPAEKIDLAVLERNLWQRRKHLDAYLGDYRRVATILFSTIIDRTKDVNGRIIRIKYNPNARVMTISFAWDKTPDFPRNVGGFCFYRDGIFDPTEIDTWPKVVVKPGWTKIADMTDDDIVERILTATGCPHVKPFAVPEEAGAFRHDAKRLYKTAAMLRTVTPRYHSAEVDDLLERIESFASRAGAILVDQNAATV